MYVLKLTERRLINSAISDKISDLQGQSRKAQIDIPQGWQGDEEKNVDGVYQTINKTNLPAATGSTKNN